MAVSMVKTRKPFDMLVNWPEYMREVSKHFSEPEAVQVWIPAVDVKESGGKYLLRADLPGVMEEDIQVTYKSGYLTIKGKRQKDNRSDDELNHMNERYYGRFERVLQFPQGINESEIQKKYKDGILELTIPIKDENKKDQKAA